MKIKVKIGEQSHWPIQYQDKETEVEITNIRFPDGSYWGCENYTGMEPSGSSESIKKSSQQGSLIGSLGGIPSKIEIIF